MDHYDPRCPACRWHLRFAPNSVVYDRTEWHLATGLNLWVGYCWNPACKFGSPSVNGFRTVGPNDHA